MSGEKPWIDLIDGTFWGGDPFPAFQWMRANEPVYHDEPNNIWALTKHRDIKDASKDPERFSNGGGIRPGMGPLPMMIDMDAPEHVERRRLVSAGFTPVRVRAMEEDIRRICDAILDEVIEAGRCDLVADIAAPLPLIVIGNMLGVDRADRPDLLRWSDDMMVGQGTDDPVVLPGTTSLYVRGACDAQAPVAADFIGKLGHMKAGFAAAPFVVTWLQQRLDSVPAPTTCGTRLPVPVLG